jgi:hypothetical protein
MARRRRPAHGRTNPAPKPQLDLFADRPKEMRFVRADTFALIVTDREPILREWRERYRQLERELAELSKKTEDYHFQAVPAYQAWVARSFGEELSAIRELEEKIHEAEIIALATLEEARASESPPSEAYLVVRLRQERGEELFPVPDDWDDGWEEVDPERDYQAEAEREESRRERPHESRKKDPDEASRNYFREKAEDAAKEEASDEAARLKALYRKLAFALHPDANPNQSPRERKIWDEVQIAYGERDLEHLEMLHAWIESGSEGWLERLTHVGTIRTLVFQKLAEVRSTGAGFNRLRKASPWKFWMAREVPERVDIVRMQIEEEFVREFMALQRRLREFELQFHRWERGPDREHPKRRRR